MARKIYVVILISLFIQDILGVSISVQPQQQIAKVGDTVIFQCKVARSLESCGFEIPNEDALSLHPSKPPHHNIQYNGTIEDLQSGSCSVRMVVQDKYNGVITCSVTPTGEAVTKRANMTLTVARKPLVPELSISSPQKGSAYLEDEQVTATCLIKNGRPAANISWYIGETRITDGLSMPTEQVSSVEALYTIEQTLSRRLKATDNGKPLKCVAEHMLLTERDNTIIRQLHVFFAPKPMKEPLEHFGLVEGEEGKITVTIQANPRPTLTWMIDELRIHEDETDTNEHFKVSRAVENQLQGPGFWDSVLIINPLENEDVERQYVLVASNGYGEQSYKVAISTNPEPRMLELGAGTIVGIVGAILLILIIVAVLLVARARGRWCFAGPVAPRLAGESSDTESAEHHHHHQKLSTPKSKMTFTKVFKKKTDKSDTDTEEAKEEALVEEKKAGTAAPTVEDVRENLNSKTEEGVVYAELDLQNSSAARGLLVRPEDEKTEYAEIIHTQNNNK